MKRLYFASCLILFMMLSACGKKENENASSPTPSAPPVSITTAPENNTVSTSPEATQSAPEATQPPYSDDDVSATLDNIHNEIKDMFGENYIPSMEYDETVLDEQFGIRSGWYDGIVAEGPMMSVHVEKFILVHATEGHLEDVQNALNTYQETILADLMQYPMNTPKIQGSVVDTEDNYVFFIMLASSEKEDESAAIEECRELNQQAADKIKDILKGQ